MFSIVELFAPVAINDNFITFDVLFANVFNKIN